MDTGTAFYAHDSSPGRQARGRPAVPSSSKMAGEEEEKCEDMQCNTTLAEEDKKESAYVYLLYAVVISADTEANKTR